MYGKKNAPLALNRSKKMLREFPQIAIFLSLIHNNKFAIVDKILKKL